MFLFSNKHKKLVTPRESTQRSGARGTKAYDVRFA
jgi:hypothetical protein